MYAEKVATWYDPTGIRCGGGGGVITPTALSKVGKYGRTCTHPYLQLSS